MSFKSVVGLDAVDVIIHVGITVVILAGVLSTTHGGEETAMLGMTITTTSLVVFALRRYLALRRQARSGLTTGEVAAERIEGLEQRVADLESAQARVYELEERLDFTERLLAREAEARKLPAAEARQL
jgi:hypothetical protein